MKDGSIHFRLPAVLGQLLDGHRDFAAEGGTLADALSDLVRREPALALHFFDDAGAVRRNILIVHNDEYLRARDALGRPLKPGDEVLIANALMGG